MIYRLLIFVRELISLIIIINLLNLECFLIVFYVTHTLSLNVSSVSKIGMIEAKASFVSHSFTIFLFHLIFTEESIYSLKSV